MDSTMQAVLQFVEENDVKFIRLAFCDVMGTLKNIAIMPGELDRAFRYGIAIARRASARVRNGGFFRRIVHFGLRARR